MIQLQELEVWRDGRKDGWKKGWTKGRTDGRMNRRKGWNSYVDLYADLIIVFKNESKCNRGFAAIVHEYIFQISMYAHIQYSYTIFSHLGNIEQGIWIYKVHFYPLCMNLSYWHPWKQNGSRAQVSSWSITKLSNLLYFQIYNHK